MCVAFFSLAGGHWLVLQTVAWAQMLRDYSKSAPIAEAIERTFSGGYPCTMCIKITEEQQKEEKAPATVKLDKKAELFLLSARDLLRNRKPWIFPICPRAKLPSLSDPKLRRSPFPSSPDRVKSPRRLPYRASPSLMLCRRVSAARSLSPIRRPFQPVPARRPICRAGGGRRSQAGPRRKVRPLHPYSTL